MNMNMNINVDEITHLLFKHGGAYKSTPNVNVDVIHDDDEYDTDEDDVHLEDVNTYNRALHLLWLSQLSGWCSMCCVVLFWTSFISVDIYKGIAANKRLGTYLVDNSYEWMQFKAGLVFGAYGLLLTALISVNCSMLYPWLRKRVSTRWLYVVAELGMALLCIMFYCTSNATWLLIFISVFGFVMQLHMQSCHELTESELHSMFTKLRESKMKTLIKYCLELANVIAPVLVSLFAGPMVYAFDGEFKFLFLLLVSYSYCLISSWSSCFVMFFLGNYPLSPRHDVFVFFTYYPCYIQLHPT